jgi:hypothetical protein
MSTLERFLLVSAIVLFIIVFYKWLLRHLRRNSIEQDFPYVHPFDGDTFSGTVPLKIEMPYPANVKVALIANHAEVVEVFFDRELEKGVHDNELDTTKAPNDTYELRITLANQVITRPFVVRN